MTKYTEEELKVKAGAMADEIIDVLTKHSPLPARAFLFALAACIEVVAESAEGDGGPSFEDCMNEFVSLIEARIARHNENNA